MTTGSPVGAKQGRRSYRMKIVVEKLVRAPLAQVWAAYVTPE